MQIFIYDICFKKYIYYQFINKQKRKLEQSFIKNMTFTD